MRKYRILLLLLILGIIAGNWYRETEPYYKTKELECRITYDQARAVLKNASVKKEYYYSQTIVYKKSRSNFPFYWNKKVVSDTGKNYFSKTP